MLIQDKSLYDGQGLFPDIYQLPKVNILMNPLQRENVKGLSEKRHEE